MFKLIFKISGWKIKHYLSDDIKQCVIVAVPHTSNWDFIYGMGAMKTMKLNARFAIKKEWMRFPFKYFMTSLGAIAIDRNKTTLGEKKGTVDAIAALFKTNETLRLVITPEGTRSKVDKWKTGFYHVAIKAGIPIALGYMNYDEKTCGIDKIIYPTGDFKKDMKEVMNFYKDVKAKNKENFALDKELL